MPIQRTAQVDDDGSGTTGTIWNNAWKTELYNQIDGVIPQGTWTPADASGAGLVFSVSGAQWARAGNLVAIFGSITYPATTNGAGAGIGGLPFPNLGPAGGLYVAYGLARNLHIPGGGSQILPFYNDGRGQYTNADMSGAVLVFSGVYLTA